MNEPYWIVAPFRSDRVRSANEPCCFVSKLPVSAMPPVVFGDGFFEIVATKIRPIFPGDVELRIAELPE